MFAMNTPILLSKFQLVKMRRVCNQHPYKELNKAIASIEEEAAEIWSESNQGE